MAGKGANFLVGTSGFSYKEWLGSFYPPKLPAAQMLAHYGGCFPTVEINQTFRGLPSREAFAKWASATPAGFVFSLKAPMRITHQARLFNAREALERFVRAGSQLSERLGPLLFQLPPGMKRDLERLGDFIKLIDSGVRAVFEFRDQSWFDDSVYDVLRGAGAALCIAETESIPDPPLIRTGSFLYLRLRMDSYDEAALERWAERLRKLASDGGDVFVYLRHAPEAPARALTLATMLGAALGPSAPKRD